jgi:phenylacetate-CoA ligase
VRPPSEAEALPWEEQLAGDDESYRAQVSYLFDRSALYREKLGSAGFSSAKDVGGLADIADLPLTEKAELHAGVSEGNPFGVHLCAKQADLARIYSTSGTTGTPSYIPLTAEDLDNWVTGSARTYGASGVEPGQTIVSTYNAGPIAAGAALGALERIGLVHVPLGTGNTERLVQAIEHLRPQAAVLTPSYAAYAAERAAERGVDLRDSSGFWLPASPAAASPRSGRDSRPRGAPGSPRRWGSGTSASRYGANARPRTGCTWARAGSYTQS